MNPKYVAIAAVAVLLAAGGAYYFLCHSGSDAVETGTYEKPLDSLEIGADDGAMRAFYVKAGGSVEIKNFHDENVDATVEAVQGPAGITISGEGAGGTASEGVYVLILNRSVGEDMDSPKCVIIGVAA